MTDENLRTQHPFAPRPADIEGAADIGRAGDIEAARREETDLERFLGGSPGAVLARLVLLSLIVGFFLVWLDIRPTDVLLGIERIVHRFWAAGFDAVREIASYIAAGAAIVVPVWLALRLIAMKPRGQNK